MNKTTEHKEERALAVDVDRLAGMLSCGHATARKVGEQAKARIVIGRRVLYSVDKVKSYLDCLAE